MVWCKTLNSFYFSLFCILCISALEYIPAIVEITRSTVSSAGNIKTKNSLRFPPLILTIVFRVFFGEGGGRKQFSILSGHKPIFFNIFNESSFAWKKHVKCTFMFGLQIQRIRKAMVSWFISRHKLRGKGGQSSQAARQGRKFVTSGEAKADKKAWIIGAQGYITEWSKSCKHSRKNVANNFLRTKTKC